MSAKRRRRPLKKHELVAKLPRAFRPRLDREQIRDLALSHTTNLDVIARGEGNEEILWQVVGGVFTWSQAAEMLDLGVDEMSAQLELVTRLVERYGATGRVIFTGVEYQLAKRGVLVMDMLAEVVDRPTAIAATDWAQAQLDSLHGARAAQAALS